MISTSIPTPSTDSVQKALCSEIVQFGCNRDGKRGHEQIVIGLLTNAEGCPVAVEVFPGNTQDASTVESKVKELRQRYGVSELVLVGDRGMITASNEEKLAALPESERLKIISALTHLQMVDLLDRTNHQPELFDGCYFIKSTVSCGLERECGHSDLFAHGGRRGGPTYALT